MDDLKKLHLLDLQLAQYIQKATVLIWKSRKVDGNLFRQEIVMLSLLLVSRLRNHVRIQDFFKHNLSVEIGAYNYSDLRISTKNYLNETEKFVYLMVLELHNNMTINITDLLADVANDCYNDERFKN